MRSWHAKGCPAGEPSDYNEQTKEYTSKSCTPACGYEKQDKPKVVVPETLKRVDPEQNWCDGCNKSSLWWAPVWELKKDGIEMWGRLDGCAECKNWKYVNLAGEEATPTLSPVKEKNIDGH